MSDDFMRGAVAGVVLAFVLFRIMVGGDRGPRTRGGYAAPAMAADYPGWKNDAPDLATCLSCRRVFPASTADEHVCPRPFADA